MSLSSRFSIVLLVTLGVTLLGFSVAMFVSTRLYLARQADERLLAYLTLLGTGADARPGYVRWEYREKRLPRGRWNEPTAMTWLVFDGRGVLLSAPKNVPLDQIDESWRPRGAEARIPDRVTDRTGRSWLVQQRLVKPTGPALPSVPRPVDTPDGKSYHDAVVIAAFASLNESQAALVTLGWFLLAISSLILIAAAASVRWMSRRMLAPLTTLAVSAQRLDPSNPGWTLEEVGTGDELEDMRGAFNDLLGRLHQAYERQRRFSGDASHQLRTPVAIMIGHLEVALRTDRSAEQYRKVVEVAHGRAVTLGRIVESLLFLSRGGSSLLSKLQPLELNEWLTHWLGNRPEDSRTADLRSAPAKKQVWIEAQPQLLGQLLENLIENACKYSDPGRMVEIKVTSARDRVALVVEDRGCGIAEADLPHIFEPFFRGDQTTAVGPRGAGLGLSVVERIATAFGGMCSVQSTLGKGSHFEVSFPCTQAPASPTVSDQGNFSTDSTLASGQAGPIDSHSNDHRHLGFDERCHVE
jgi:signal transduction histidine kinase